MPAPPPQSAAETAATAPASPPTQDVPPEAAPARRMLNGKGHPVNGTSGPKAVANGNTSRTPSFASRYVSGNGHRNPSSSIGANGHTPGRSVSVNGTTKSNVIAYDVTCVQEPGRIPQRFREAPIKLVWYDLRFLFKYAWLLPSLFMPFEPLGLDQTPRTLLGQVVMTVVSIVLTIIFLLSCLLSAPLIPALFIGIFCLISLHYQGQGTRESKSGVEIDVSTGTEAWFSVNGVCTTSTGAELIANHIEKLFHRRVTAIINCSFGLWFDILECILQRDLLLITPDIRKGYIYIHAAVRDPRKKRVVIFAHSQGGIIVSAWVDQLLCDFPEEILSKVEIYTFASAANHFSRPTSKGLDFPFLRTTGSTTPFGRVEHFANENDFVAQFGVLGNAPKPPPNLQPGDPIPTLNGVFGGRIFVRRHHTGHLFNSHYLLPSDSILDDPEVRRNSKLMNYLDGKGVAK